ncbi:MAG: DUF3883 domain-containing protein [Gemmataceae bacterium]
MAFSVEDDALIVDNDGVFSECADVNADECEWKEDGIHNHRCDFHRFRRIASGDKRGQEGTTGAFGIGFIAVYQITDTPELISAGRHWILHENRTEDQRIEVCSGCASCGKTDLPGTRFILPWARDPESDLRRALRAESISADGPDRFLAELRSSLPTAMLFLKRLRVLEVARNGKRVQRLERLDDGDSLILSNGDPEADQVWHIIEGDFGAAAQRLRTSYPGKIEPKRSSIVKLAIPAGELATGLLCACLPTEQDLDLPFHLNADFYTSNDRKRIILAEDYQSLWNREAIRAAALTLGRRVDQLPNLIGAKPLWAMMERLSALATKAEQGRIEAVLGDFWKSCAPALRSSPVVLTSAKEWTTVSDSSLLLQKEEAEALDVLQALGLRIVHEDLRPYQSLLRSKSVGIAVLDVRCICDALSSQGLECRKELAELPDALATESRRKMLWKELGVLLERPLNDEAKAEDELRLRRIALAPGRDGALWPCASIFTADPETVALFEKLELQIPFLKEHPDFPAQLARLCPRFDASAAIESLAAGVEALKKQWESKHLPIADLMAWFENRRQQILADPTLKRALTNLPIFPSASRLRPLTELALPGNFDDPLGVAELVDLSVLGDRRSFLSDLGAPDLDFPTYAASMLPKILSGAELPADKRRAAVLLLASRLGEVKDNRDAQRALIGCSLVECCDKVFRPATECYFDNAAVRDCLDDSAHFAILPKSQEAAVRDLYVWLGVASQPRLDHLLTKIQELAAGSYSSTSSQVVERIFAHLGKRIEADEDFSLLSSLKSIRWLPARGKTDRWYAPTELYADYQAYLFESQALILDLPNRVQTSSRRLLEFLGVRVTPEPSLVVKHLLFQASRGVAVNTGVYDFLNDKASDPALSQLRGKACLWLGDAYRRPDEVFWGEHPFGRYRWRLGDQLKTYSKFLTAIDVREAPATSDFLRVLKEVSAEFGTANTTLDDEAHSVLLECWRALSQALRDEVISRSELEELRILKCVPDKTRVLNRPDWMFFENRAGLADKFGSFLNRNVIPRPLDTGAALAAAGVRPLGTAVVVELLECRGVANDPELHAHILGRRNEIARVLDALGAAGGTSDVLERLSAIQCYFAESIEIRYRLHAFEQERQSDPEQVPALYQVATGALVYARRDHLMPWASIARELAIALYPDDDPGRFAAGLKEALAAATPEDAAAVLDELGFARLDISVAPPVANGNTADGLGTGNDAGGNLDQAGLPSEQPGNGMSPEEALGKLLGQDAPDPTPSPQPEGSPEQTGVGAGGRTGGSSNASGMSGHSGSGKRTGDKRTPGSKGGRRFISYLAAELDEEEPDHDGLDSLKRQALEEEAIRIILAGDPRLHRTPRHNPGYDLFEPDEHGAPKRLVEVKAMTGSLHDRPVGMSDTQFECAQKHGEAFWLYVVEQAGTPNARIVRIQDPAGRARTFTFDEGWLAVAEIESSKNEHQDKVQDGEDRHRQD